MRLKKIDIQVEPIKREDLAEVIEIERLSFSSPWTKGMFLSELEDNPFSCSYVARSAQKVAGYVCFWVIHEEEHLLNLAVHPEYRRLGIGEALLHFAIEEGKKKGMKVILLEVRSSNEIARKLYEKFGFKVIGLRGGYYDRPKDDAVIMALTLNPPPPSPSPLEGEGREEGRLFNLYNHSKKGGVDMVEEEKELIEYVRGVDEEFRRLEAEHKNLDEEIRRILQLRHPTPDEELRLKVLQKEKLYAKDRLAEILRSYKSLKR